MVPVITREMKEQIENLLKRGSRVEILIEQGNVSIVEIKRKLRMKANDQNNGSDESNGAVSI